MTLPEKSSTGRPSGDATPAHVVGIDLAGPAGMANTGAACFEVRDGTLRFEAEECDGSDVALLALIRRKANDGPVVVGIDAPLSYEPGGGQRRRDAGLRERIVARGMRPGSVMAPTAPRMVYLTLRGIALAHALSERPDASNVSIVEVHPGAAMCLRRANLRDVMTFATDDRARAECLRWLAGQGFHGGTAPPPGDSHFVAACAAALAAWRWHLGRHEWRAPAEPPWHPYEFAC